VIQVQEKEEPEDQLTVPFFPRPVKDLIRKTKFDVKVGDLLKSRPLLGSTNIKETLEIDESRVSPLLENL
jgi:hypothetical protein